jgi:hypothetical protein
LRLASPRTVSSRRQSLSPNAVRIRFSDTRLSLHSRGHVCTLPGNWPETVEVFYTPGPALLRRAYPASPDSLSAGDHFQVSRQLFMAITLQRTFSDTDCCMNRHSPHAGAAFMSDKHFEQLSATRT